MALTEQDLQLLSALTEEQRRALSEAYMGGATREGLEALYSRLVGASTTATVTADSIGAAIDNLISQAGDYFGGERTGATPPPPREDSDLIGQAEDYLQQIIGTLPPLPTGGGREIPPSGGREIPPNPTPGPEFEGPPTETEPTEENLSAKALLIGTLAEFGLESLGEWAWNLYLQGVPTEQIFLDMRARPEYKARFPAMDVLAQKGRAISEAQYIDLERTYTQILRANGLPTGFYDQPIDFADWIGGEVSPLELQRRVEEGYVAALQAPEDVRSTLQQYYGIGSGDLAAFFLDPDQALPLILRKFASAQLGATATRTGFQGLDAGEAELLAAFGVTPGQASEGFSELVRSRELFGVLPGEAGTAISEEEQLAAAFGTGGSVAAQERIRRRQSERIAKFSEGGGFATTREGVSGVGAAE